MENATTMAVALLVGGIGGRDVLEFGLDVLEEVAGEGKVNVARLAPPPSAVVTRARLVRSPPSGNATGTNA
jgi:hypothetical protein